MPQPPSPKPPELPWLLSPCLPQFLGHLTWVTASLNPSSRDEVLQLLDTARVRGALKPPPGVPPSAAQRVGARCPAPLGAPRPWHALCPHSS